MEKEVVLYKQETGEYREDYGFEIVESVSFSRAKKWCKHCVPPETVVHTRSDGSTWENLEGKSPIVVVAYNEAGHNSTAVCLECIIEAAREKGLIPPETIREKT